MRAKRLIILILLVALVLIFLVWTLRSGYPNTIPFFANYGIEFGVSPKTVMKSLGEPIRSDDWSSDSVSNQAWYSFQIIYMGKPAHASFAFLEDRSLCQLDIQIECASEQEALALSDELVSTLKTAYNSHKDYYYRESENVHSVATGLFDGAVGIQYEIKVTGCNVTVSGINQD